MNVLKILLSIVFVLMFSLFIFTCGYYCSKNKEQNYELRLYWNDEVEVYQMELEQK